MRSDPEINRNSRARVSLSSEEIKRFFELRHAYSTISNTYLRLKKKPWRQFEELLIENKDFVPDIDGKAILDAGSGNGRNLALFDNASLKVGIDPIYQLIKTVPDFNAIPVLGSITHPPFRKQSFDFIISVAVIHHFSKPETRVLVIKNLLELLLPRGTLLITVWKRDRKGNIGKTIEKLIAGENSQDEFLPWKDTSGKVIAKRYYHYFTRQEFKELIFNFEKYLLKWGSFGGKIKQNFYAIFKKS